MSILINAQKIAKVFGATTLFRDVSLTISEGDRIGLIGPNGSGKSTLLKVLAGEMESDDGNVTRRKRLRVSYVAQDSEFDYGRTIRQVITESMQGAQVPEADREGRLAETLGRVGFQDFNAEAAALSGGWRKRLAIAEALVQQPDLLFLDEPTNHLDLAGIEWLEDFVRYAQLACVIVSHDRYFLENVASRTAELNRVYENGLLLVEGNYSEFLVKKEEFLEAQTKRQESLENRVKTEIEWLRRGPKARTTKSKARTNKANELIGELADLNARTRSATADIDFSATERRTKRLIEMEQVTFQYGERTLFRDLDFLITAGTRVGLVGPNGSGKTTILRLLNDELQPVSGEIKRANALRIVYFDQNRQLDPDITLRRALAPEGDSVVYQDRLIHVASWAARFLFDGQQLNQPVGSLSGGERARVLIAKLMLQPADVLLLDEPTNDLDIPTLEILEESLLEFRGALVLVTHDRYMLDRVSTVVLGLDGFGQVERFADYSQWDEWQRDKTEASKVQPAATKRETAAPPPQKKKLSYMEAREYSTIEQRIHEAEQRLKDAQSAYEDPTISTNAERLITVQAEVEAAQGEVDALIVRWTELEEKQG
ncbi:ABC transporter, ATPase subunit [Candidatus Koribacter versatilis Ellin345]|uniref:ABC transporter, ATPase subunit n=1 Tax=Koribacter versatilis (strain Ellin345) TaxID=204669 RepID=Q1IKA9_KORVE|nr:ABC-F family ATP-binding cassette domain-containing protein [Candidatus Koribacter versatilis]ABF42691.1 ABC transporter, ATPase subunit [Candidatus Koribacter versatilis Ellin345]